MPKRTSLTGSELLIVDNSDEDWKVVRYAAEQCRANSGPGSHESVVKALISMLEPFKEACSIPPTVRVPLKSF
jgi:hypothetical protein